MNNDQKLENFAEREFRRHMHNLIVPDDEGGIVVFGRYRIIEENKNFAVYTYEDRVCSFSSKRIAMGWCIAEHRNQLRLANSIRILDNKKQQLAADIYCRKVLADRGRSSDFNELVNTKIQPKISNYQAVISELEKCVISAKYLQIRGFNNETARTGRS